MKLEKILSYFKSFPVLNRNLFITEVVNLFGQKADKVYILDGLSAYFASYCFNLGKSDTAKLARLNVEASGGKALLELSEKNR